MIAVAIVIILALCLLFRALDKRASAQRASDAASGAPTQALQRADGCASGCGWVFLLAVLGALVGAAMIGGLGG